MAPIGKRPCLYFDSRCIWITPTHHLITTREETEAYIRAHSYKYLHNPPVRETRQRTLQREEAKKLRLIEANER